MNIEEIMTHGLDQIDPDSTIVQAAMIMARDDIGFLALIENGEVVGVLSDRDIVIRGLTGGGDLNDVKIRQVMSCDPVFCRTDDKIDTAAQIMSEHKLRRLIVKDENDVPVGCVSLGDLASRAHIPELCGHVLEDVCAGHAMSV